MIFIIGSKKKIFTYFVFFLGCILVVMGVRKGSGEDASVETMKETGKAYIAVIIDDFGNGSKGTEEMLSLPVTFTGAVMPSMPYTEQECEMLKKAGKDIILHMPMEPHTGKKSWLGPTPILNEYDEEKSLEIFKQCLGQIKYCSGFNNHMGSKVTENKTIIGALLREVKDKGLIVVDSVTGPKSVVGEMAEELGVCYLKRDVFLDSTQDLGKVKQNMLKAGKIALEKGYAVAIGHVGAEGGLVTAKAISETYKELESQGICFVGVRELCEILNEAEH